MKHSFSYTGETIDLRPLSYEDSQAYRRLRNLEENRKCFIFDGIISEDAQKKWYEAYLADESDYMFSVYDKKGQFLGGTALYHIEGKKAEFGRLLIDKKAAGRGGVGYEALLATAAVARKQLGLEVLSLEAMEGNMPAIRTYEKAGFSLKKQYYLPSENAPNARLFCSMEKNLTEERQSVILITSTYNGAGYLPAMLDSIEAQTYPRISLYVRDDGSRDDSVSILRKYQKRFTGGKKLLLVNDRDQDWSNKGSHQSYRYLLQNLGEADYYLFCDQDDVWAPDKVERAVRAMEAYDPSIPLLYVHNYYVCDENLNIEHTLPPRPTVLPRQMPSVNLAKVIMTGTWGGVGMAQGFNRRLKTLAFDAGDITPAVAVDCWISWVVAGMNGALLYDEKPLAYYRRHPGVFSSGGAGGLLRYRDWARHRKRHCDNIVNGIHDYRRLYSGMVSPERARFLELFDSRRRFAKLFYPHRLRSSLLDETAFRILILMGKI